MNVQTVAVAACVLCMWGCARPTPPPSQHSVAADTLWIAADGAPRASAGPGLWLTSNGAPTHPSVCTAASRGGPLWQQLDLSTVRVVCLADANHLPRKQRLEQRYQAPAAVAPSGVDHLILALPDAEGAGAVVLQDLLDASDPMALRIVVQRGAASSAELPSGPWGLLRLTVAPGADFLLTHTADGLMVTPHTGDSLVFTDVAGWSTEGVAE